METDTLKKIEVLENYVNSDVELTAEDIIAYNYYLNKLKTANAAESLEYNKKIVEVSTSKTKRERIKNILPILNRIKKVIETLDARELKKISLLRKELYETKKINDDENNSLIDILKDVYEIMFVQDNFIISEIESLIQQDHTKDNLKQIEEKIQMIVNPQLISQYKVKLLLIKAENAINEKNKDSAYDFLHSALEELTKIEDIPVKNTLHVMLANIRRKINLVSEDKPISVIDDDVNNAKAALDKAKKTLNKEDLNKAIDLINALSESDEKKALLEEAKLIDAEIKEHEKNKTLIEKAKKLVEIVENTEKSKDFARAYEAVKSLPDCDEKVILQERLLKVCENNTQHFTKLMDKIRDDIDDEKDIAKKDIDELSDRYQYLNDSYISSIKDIYDRIINIYNNQVQNEYQQGLTKEDIKKYSFADKFRELFGAGVVTKIAKIFNKSKLRKRNEELLEIEKAKKEKRISNDEYDEMKAMIKPEIEKINKRISYSDVIGGVRLFTARNSLAKKKPKLYKEGLDNSGFKRVIGDGSNSDMRLYQTKATNTISKKLIKGLSKKLRDESIGENKDRVLTILDQYLELISSGTYDKDYVIYALNFLESVKSILSDSEYNGYRDEIQMIDGYRKSNSGMPYHMNNIDDNHEVDNVIKYYDSDAYENAVRQERARYIKGK